MADTTFLNGKVLKQSLAVFDGRPPADAPRLKRLLLPQGELAQVHDGEPAIRYLACLELRPDTIRGNHYHKLKNEFLYLSTGRAVLTVEDCGTAQRESIQVSAGDLVFIPVGIAHAFRTIQAGQGIEFSTSEFSAADVYFFSLLSA